MQTALLVPTEQWESVLSKLETVDALKKRVEVLESRQQVDIVEIAEAARQIKKCEATARAMAKRGDLKMIRSGHKIYVTLASVNAWNEKHLIN